MLEPGGWVYDCGHFSPSDFLQVVKGSGLCAGCYAAKQILQESKDLKRRKVSGPSFYKTDYSGLSRPMIISMTKKRITRR